MLPIGTCLPITILQGTHLFCDADLQVGFLELPLVKQVLPEIPSVFSFTHHHICVAILWLHT